jgi:PIN domain nuclease of toxin-antitoxin system
MEPDGGFASWISIGELGVKLQRNKLDIGITIDQLTWRMKATRAVDLLPVDGKTWLRGLEVE